MIQAKILLVKKWISADPQRLRRAKGLFGGFWRLFDATDTCECPSAERQDSVQTEKAPPATKAEAQCTLQERDIHLVPIRAAKSEIKVKGQHESPDEQHSKEQDREPWGASDRLRSLRARAELSYLSRINELRKIVESRRIQALFHFTRLENLADILMDGLKPRTELPESSAVINDPVRSDGFKDASSLSISFPNYRVFYKFRQCSPEAKWVVIEFDVEVLYRHFCLFSETNAASAVSLSIGWLERACPEALQRMFRDELFDREKGVTIRREQLKIRPHLPTDPQSEVLVCGTIRPDLIRRVAFQSDRDKNRWISENSEHTQLKRILCVDRSLFAPRVDFRFWSGNKT